ETKTLEAIHIRQRHVEQDTRGRRFRDKPHSCVRARNVHDFVSSRPSEHPPNKFGIRHAVFDENDGRCAGVWLLAGPYNPKVAGGTAVPLEGGPAGRTRRERRTLPS